MTPHLIEALSRLSPLTPAELALLSATATSLAAQSGRVRPERPPASPKVEALPAVVARPRPVEGRAGSPDERWLDLLATTNWAEGLTVDDALFASAAYRKRLGLTVPTLFYIAGSSGLKRLADLIGRTVFKPGVTQSTATANAGRAS